VRRDKKTARGGALPLGVALQSYLAQSGLGKKLQEVPILDAWSQAVGERLAQRARAVCFQNGELEVEVDSAVHRQELVSFTGEQFRRLANQRLGREEIRSVVFKLKK
jgi:hypothetical protein